MAQKRACGNCTACCKTHQVLSIQKEAGQWCQHCASGVGCRIYDSRPEECHVFRCQWLFGYGSVADRPDTTNVVVDYHKLEITDRMTASLWELEPGALESRFAEDQKQVFFDNRFHVLLVYCDGRQILCIPKGTTFFRGVTSRLLEARVRVFQYQLLPAQSAAADSYSQVSPG
ncbi:MAG: hypothetical protein AAB476_00970 [Patescibacteria group bacterium]